MVVSWEEGSLDNTQLAYYYWSEYFLYLQLQGQQMPATLDPKQPLESQMYDQNSTWADYMLSRTLDTVEHTMAMVFAAQEAGFTLPPEDETALVSILEEFSYKALEMGFSQDGQGDLEAYFQDSYGEGATVDSFTQYLRNATLAAAYSDHLYQDPQFSQEEVKAYFEDNAGKYADAGISLDDTTLPTIRTILYTPQDVANDDSWNQAKQAALTLYDTWRSEGGLESDFSALASAHSQDKASSSKGGLMEAITPAQISGQLAHWVFEEPRQPGDSAVLSTDTGWAIAYYVTPGDTTAWEIQCQRDLRNDTYDQAFQDILDQYPLEFHPEALNLPTPNGLFQ